MGTPECQSQHRATTRFARNISLAVTAVASPYSLDTRYVRSPWHCPEVSRDFVLIKRELAISGSRNVNLDAASGQRISMRSWNTRERDGSHFLSQILRCVPRSSDSHGSPQPSREFLRASLNTAFSSIDVISPPNYRAMNLATPDHKLSPSLYSRIRKLSRHPEPPISVGIIRSSHSILSECPIEGWK